MNKTILIIEDNRGIQISLMDELESEGYRVYVAGDGKEGFTLIHEKNPDLIILDIMLPGMDGYEVCKKIRSEGNTTPVIMLRLKIQKSIRF